MILDLELHLGLACLGLGLNFGLDSKELRLTQLGPTFYMQAFSCLECVRICLDALQSISAT